MPGREAAEPTLFRPGPCWVAHDCISTSIAWRTAEHDRGRPSSLEIATRNEPFSRRGIALSGSPISLAALPITRAGTFVESLGLVPHPFDEVPNLLVEEQLVDGRIRVRQLRLGEQRVKLTMADTMQDDGILAALRFRHEVMEILLLRRHASTAQSAMRVLRRAIPGIVRGIGAGSPFLSLPHIRIGFFV